MKQSEHKIYNFQWTYTVKLLIRYVVSGIFYSLWHLVNFGCILCQYLQWKEWNWAISLHLLIIFCAIRRFERTQRDADHTEWATKGPELQRQKTKAFFVESLVFKLCRFTTFPPTSSCSYLSRRISLKEKVRILINTILLSWLHLQNHRELLAEARHTSCSTATWNEKPWWHLKREFHYLVVEENIVVKVLIAKTSH